MKVSREKMAEHREQIIASAAKRFRERGFEGIGVADLMKEVGLTHGGFYGHFASKEELIELASERVMDNATAKWGRVLTEAKGDPLQALAKSYLSQSHWRKPGVGCLFPSLGGEIARQPLSVRRAVSNGLQRLFRVLSEFVPAKTETARRKKAIAAYASLVGGMVLARSTTNTALAEEILQAVAESISEAAATA